jgi:hypothetical protein
MTIEVARLAAQVALGVVFLASTVGKLRSPAAFVRGVAEYRILPTPLAHALGVVLIPVEASLALAYLGGWWLSAALPLGVAMLLVFALAVAITLVRNRDIACHCFGGLADERVSGRSLAQLGLLGAAALFAWSGGGRSGWRTAQGMDPVLVVAWALFLLLAGVWLLRAEEVVRLFRKRRCKSCSGAAAGGRA